MNHKSFPAKALRSAPLVALIALLPSSGLAKNFSFAGTFSHDDERRELTVVLDKPGQLSVKTLSYAGGSTVAGTLIPPGGFDPSLSLFDSTGTLIGVNRDGSCADVQSDPATAFCWDAFLSESLPAGTYQVVLTESENLPEGPAKSDPFVYDGFGNFTADPVNSTSSGFWDFSLNKRNGAFAVDILNADSAQLGLTPSASALVSAASFLPAQLTPNTILTFYDAGLAGGPPDILVAGQKAEVLYSGASQVNFVIPGTLPSSGTGTIQISRGGSILLSSSFQVGAAAPALFTSNSQGTGQAAVLNQDYSLNGPSIPARRGTYIVAYGTGFGAAQAPGSDGLSLLAQGVTASIGGVPADVSFAGLAPGYTPGLQQINLLVPENAPVGDAVGIQLTVAGISTQMGATVAIQ